MEIPELLANLSQQYPEVELRYAWPVDLCAFADFLCAHLDGR